MFQLIFLLLVWWAPLSAWFDLEELTRSFVLETKKIDIPGYPAAFNPSIIRWQGQLWMSFRSYDRATFPINTLGLIPLDECFNPSGVPQILDILGAHSGMDVRAQDIRLIAVGEALYIVYNRMDQQNKCRMCVAKLQKQAGQFVIEQPEYLTQFPDMQPERDEKNWVPFSYKDQLLLAYSLSPHRILSLYLQEQEHATSLRSQKETSLGIGGNCEEALPRWPMGITISPFFTLARKWRQSNRRACMSNII